MLNLHCFSVIRQYVRRFLFTEEISTFLLLLFFFPFRSAGAYVKEVTCFFAPFRILKNTAGPPPADKTTTLKSSSQVLGVLRAWYLWRRRITLWNLKMQLQLRAMWVCLNGVYCFCNGWSSAANFNKPLLFGLHQPFYLPTCQPISSHTCCSEIMLPNLAFQFGIFLHFSYFSI